MSRKSYLLLFLVIIINLPLGVSQTNAYWTTNASFDFGNNFNSSSGISSFTQGTISDNQGNLLFYSNSDGVYDRENTLLPSSSKSNLNATFSMFLRLGKYEFMYIYNYDVDSSISKDADTFKTTGLFYSLIDLRLNNGRGDFVKHKMDVLVLKEWKFNYLGSIIYSTIGAARIGVHNYLLYTCLGDNLWALEVKDKELKVLDSLNIGRFDSVKAQLNFWKCNGSENLNVSNRGTEIYLAKNLSCSEKVNYISHSQFVNSYSHSIIEKINFDPILKKLSYDKRSPIFKHKVDYLDSANSHKVLKSMYFYSNNISLNDSFIYLYEHHSEVDFKYYPKLIENYLGSNSKLIQLDLWDENSRISTLIEEKDKVNFNEFKMTPNGMMIGFGSNSANSYMYAVKKPNRKYPFCNFEPSFKSVDHNKRVNNYFTIHVFDNLRFEKEITYDCKATVTFENLSGAYVPLDTFYWWVQNEEGGMDSFMAKEPTLTFTKSGDYLYKVHGITEKGNGFGEAYYDTIKIRIPQKPVAHFTVSDTVLCRYLPVTFTNLSHSQDTNPASKQEWIWDFGDGNSFLGRGIGGEVTHAYQDPGTYTVSLTYKNGYCDSTLTLTNRIRVVDAPKAGFTIKDTQGCAPFTAQFTDTVWHNVLRKEYFFSDSNKWVGVTQDNFSHVFAKSGTFRAVQRLHGYTGCIITTDSVFVHVSQGILETDTSHILNSTFLTNESIQLEWNPIDAAVKYKVYRDNKVIATTTSTNLIDTFPVLQEYTYKVLAEDSCGTESKIGRIGKPIFLTATVHGKNEYSIISYTPYEKWKESTIEYEIINVDNGIETSIVKQQDTSSYVDLDFAESHNLEKCYQISARGLTNGRETRSNLLCLPYVPTLFIPDAFTPNGDGLNDVFRPNAIGIATYSFKVYSMWGEQIFTSQENDSWDPGQSIQQGVYLYTIEFRDNQGERGYTSGTVTLLR